MESMAKYGTSGNLVFTFLTFSLLFVLFYRKVQKAIPCTLAKINFSCSILFHLTISYSSYFEGKKGISRNKTSFFLLMLLAKVLARPIMQVDCLHKQIKPKKYEKYN